MAKLNRILLTMVSLGAVLSGCAQTSTIPLTKNMVKITATAAPICGATGAQKVALQTAAVETIKRGYDKFIIGGEQYENHVKVVGYTPVVAQSTGSVNSTLIGNTAYSNGSSFTTFSGGQPIIGGTQNQGLVVKMFKANEPESKNAVDARQTLGPKWKEIVKDPSSACI